MPDDGQSVLADIEQSVPLVKRHRSILFTASSRALPLVAINRDIPILKKPFDVDDLLIVVTHAADFLATDEKSPFPRE